MKREPGKRKRVPNHAWVHRDDPSFFVIASSWQTARITRSDTRRPTLPPPPPLPCMVCCISCFVVYVVYNPPKGKEHASNPSCRVCWVEEREGVSDLLDRSKNHRIASGWSKKKINPYPYPPPPPPPYHPTSSRLTTLSSHLPSALLPLLPPPLPPPHAR